MFQTVFQSLTSGVSQIVTEGACSWVRDSFRGHSWDWSWACYLSHGWTWFLPGPLIYGAGGRTMANQGYSRVHYHMELLLGLARTMISGSATWSCPAFSKHPSCSWTPMVFHNFLPRSQSSHKFTFCVLGWLPNYHCSEGNTSKRPPILPSCWCHFNHQFQLIILFSLDQYKVQYKC